MNDPSIELHGVSKSFGSIRALDSVSLDLRPGITGLLGPNGAGKTTLLRILATVSTPDNGAVRVLGLDPCDPTERRRIRKSLGYLPQEAGLYENFRVGTFLDYIAVLKGLGAKGVRRRDVERVLGLVELSGVARRRIRTLSGGMRRRVGIAQALLGNPSLQILDEPTAGLDPEQRIQFRSMLSGQDPPKTVLLSTHQTDDVAAFCQRVVVINHGRLLFEGTPEELRAAAMGRVWIDSSPDTSAIASWKTSNGKYHNVGSPPSGASIVPPTIDDGYLVLLGRSSPMAT
ncbi:MAG TPA: ABC transporter ATP-binding protein [Actinomycetota bacterium]